MLTCIVAFGRGIILRFKKDGARLTENSFAIWLFIAFGLLIIAMGYPFTWNDHWVLNHFSFFKQFRSLGRFSWGFYYIITVYTVVMLHKWYKGNIEKGRPVLGYAILIVPYLFWSWEAMGFVNFMHTRADEGAKNYNYFFDKEGNNWLQFLQEHNHNAADYACMVALPYFHLGSEKLWVCDEKVYGDELPSTVKASYQLQLPMINVLLARTSWSQTFEQVRLVAGPLAQKPPYLQKSSKPFLLLCSSSASIDPDSRCLVAASDIVGDFGGYHVYTCYPGRLLANDKKYKDSMLAISNSMNVADTCINCDAGYYIDHMDNGTLKNVFWGKGAAADFNKYDTVMLAYDIKNTDSVQYEFSTWILLNNIDYSSPHFDLSMLDSAGNVISTITVATSHSVDNKDMWFRTSAYFIAPPLCRKISSKFINWGYLGMDELQLRPANATVISKYKDSTVLVNNHRLK